MICLETNRCEGNSCIECVQRLAAIDALLSVSDDQLHEFIKEFYADHPEIKFGCEQVFKDYMICEDSYQRQEYEITGSCSHGCSADLLVLDVLSGDKVCKLTGRTCDSQRLSGIVDAYSIINAPKGKTKSKKG